MPFSGAGGQNEAGSSEAKDLKKMYIRKL